MPHRRGDWKGRIDAAAREHAAARLGLDLLAGSGADADFRLAAASLRRADVADALANLEGTFAVRCFTLFEAALRSFWLARVRPSAPAASVLIDRVAARCGVTDPLRLGAHEARVYRNALVHEGEADRLPLHEVAARLGRYVGRMPKTW